MNENILILISLEDWLVDGDHLSTCAAIGAWGSSQVMPRTLLRLLALVLELLVVKYRIQNNSFQLTFCCGQSIAEHICLKSEQFFLVGTHEASVSCMWKGIGLKFAS